MIEYSVQYIDENEKWVFPVRIIRYRTKELAQRYIDFSVKLWKERKEIKFQPMYAEILSNPENWRIVQREVSKWTVSE